MAESKSYSAVQEDYLEVILHLVREKGAARVRDIADALSVHKSTVTAALRSLAEKKLVNYNPYEITTLTPKGRRVAEEVAHRHEVIQRFLSDILLVEEKAASENACRMEHVLDKEVFKRLALFAQFVRECPRSGNDWIECFGHYIESGGKIERDDAKVRNWLREMKKKLREQGKKRGTEKGPPA